MRSRDNILILLFTATLGLGTLILLQAGDDGDALLRFRSLLSNRTVHNLSDILTSIADGTSLWYGGISLFAIIMIALAFRAARGGDLQALRERLAELEAAKAEAEKLLHDGVLRERHARQAKDAALQDLEGSARRIYALENQLGDKRDLLHSRDEELKILRSQLSTLTDGPSDQAESLVREELKKKTDLVQAKDSVITELENSLRGKQELLQSRSKEVETLKSKINTLTEQLTDSGLAKERVENVLQREVQKKTELLQAKESGVTEESLMTRIQALEGQLTEKEGFLKAGDAELEELRSKVSRFIKLSSVREQAKSVLEQELKNRTEHLQAKEVTVRELQHRLSTTVLALENAQSELERLVKEREAASPVLSDQATETRAAKEQADGLIPSRRKGLNSRLHELGAAKARVAGSLQPEEAKGTSLANEFPSNESEEILTTVQGQEILLTEQDELLEADDRRMEEFETELTKKEGI